MSTTAPMVKGGADTQARGTVTVTQTKVELRTPRFVFTLDASDGLRAESWENLLTGTKLSLGMGGELELDIGESEESAVPVKLRVTGLPDQVQALAGKAVFQLEAKESKIVATVAYQWDAAQPVLRKFVKIVNAGDRPLNRLLNVRLGAYQTDANQLVAKGRGFPLFLNNEFSMGLAHPSGWAVNQGKEVSLRHHPGRRLAPGENFACMEAVYGVARPGGAQQAFMAHLTQRMRRVVRGHDKPCAIFDAFGWDPLWETEAYLLDNIRKVAKGQEESGCHFDYYSVDFWHDPAGDLIRFHPRNFPNGFAPIKQALEQLGTAPGLYVDSGGSPGWSIGGNPAIKPAMTDPSGRGSICRAAEPAKSLYTKAFIHHIRENGVRLLKFDHNGNKDMVCNNPHHDHLPGVFSTEANHNAIIEFLNAMDRECPKVFLMLYWGYSSPWWLLHADTMFDCGLPIEARDPASQPAAYPRSSVIQRMDQGHRTAVTQRDIPALGRDSLGVWLSKDSWNSSIGKEGWQDSLVMDMCRGSTLVQIFTDRDWLSPPERAQMADFVALVKAQPNCFRNSRWIVGDPWKNEPYGYCCTDGKRAFVAIHNACWRDSSVALKLGSEWGLPDGRSWDIYRWYPDPSRLTGAKSGFGQSASITMRPFEVVLLEVVPDGQAPSLDRRWKSSAIPAGFAEPTRTIEFGPVEEEAAGGRPAEKSIWTPLGILSAVSAGGATLTVQKDGSILAGGKNPPKELYTLRATTRLTGITAIQLEVLCDETLPKNGPGRAVNGNLALTEFRVTAAPAAGKADGVTVSFRNAKADFSQTSYGGWPVAAAIDGKLETGWSIDPQEGASHVAIFETEKPVGLDGGTVLTFTLEQGNAHGVGRFRLSVTSAKPPVPIPAEYRGAGAGPGRNVAGQIPPAAKGGTLVVVSPGATLGALTATLGGEPAVCTPVWGASHVRASWQAWRIAVGPSSKPQEIVVAAGGDARRTARRVWKGYFIPLER